MLCEIHLETGASVMIDDIFLIPGDPYAKLLAVPVEMLQKKKGFALSLWLSK